jgi:hypothetical protein
MGKRLRKLFGFRDLKVIAKGYDLGFMQEKA